MTAQNGDLVLLKIGDGGSPTEIFTPLGGLRATGFALDNRSPDATSLASGPWRELLTDAGIRSLTVTGSGSVTDSAAEATLRDHALQGGTLNYELIFGNGGVLSGPFRIAAYQRTGDFGSEETYSLTLTSAGEITYTAA